MEGYGKVVERLCKGWVKLCKVLPGLLKNENF